METTEKMNTGKSKGFTNLAIACGGVGLFYSVLSLVFGRMARKEFEAEMMKEACRIVDETDQAIDQWKDSVVR